jgi:hypothetical protein
MVFLNCTAWMRLCEVDVLDVGDHLLSRMKVRWGKHRSVGPVDRYSWRVDLVDVEVVS